MLECHQEDQIKAPATKTVPLTRVVVHNGYSFNCIASTSVTETNQVFCQFILSFLLGGTICQLKKK